MSSFSSRAELEEDMTVSFLISRVNKRQYEVYKYGHESCQRCNREVTSKESDKLDGRMLRWTMERYDIEKTRSKKRDKKKN